MLCQKPFTRGMHAYPCGQCMPCRFNRRRIWAHRIMLEASQHGDNTFVTLTYSDQNIPRTSTDLPTLDPKHLQDWLKRLRFINRELRIRYFAVGEYGDETWRPHYHLALFGHPNCQRGQTDLRREWCCGFCQSIKSSWGKGAVMLAELNVNSAQYVAGYVTKKMTRTDDPRLSGRHPEFSRMSLRPGIGHDFMHEVASTMLSFNLDQSQADVPSALRHGNRTLPLGRYLRNKLRTMIGKEGKAPQETLDEQAEEMRPLLEAARADPENPSLRGQIVKASKSKVLQMEARSKIFKPRKPL